ncbi:MAG: hypothetical protein JNL11_17965 [Bdellovibrionaceae bacterium]|nr:hypothetical protein [Pseudobdellovibrionaceae bacterium]
MKFKERNYSTQIIRPKPTILKSSELDLLVIMTCWGESTFKDRVFEEIQKFVFAAEGDVEVTSPFEMNTYLSRDCNFLRMCALLINDLIYRGENRDVFTSCYELTILFRKKKKLSWVQVGSPNLYLYHDRLIPLSVAVPSIHSSSENTLALPQQYLGTEMHCHFQLGEVTVDPSQKLLLCTESSLHKDTWSIKKDDFTIENAFKNQIQLDPDSPFWMAMIDFND